MVKLLETEVSALREYVCCEKRSSIYILYIYNTMCSLVYVVVFCKCDIKFYFFTVPYFYYLHYKHLTPVKIL